MEGLLQDIHLTDIIQLFELTGKTGAVQLLPIGYVQQGSAGQAGLPIGQIFFRDGRITDARLGPLQGEEALFSLFLWRAGTFQFLKDVRSPTISINQTNESLLLEGVQRMDEWLSILEHVPTLQMVLYCSPQAPPQVEQIRLTEGQWRLLRALNGRDTLATIATRCGLSPFQTRIIATKLLATGFSLRRPPTQAEGYFEGLVGAASRDLGEVAEPLLEFIFAQAGVEPALLAGYRSLPPSFAARILPELEAAAARYIGPHRAQRLKERLEPVAQPA